MSRIRAANWRGVAVGLKYKITAAVSMCHSLQDSVRSLDPSFMSTSVQLRSFASPHPQKKSL